MRFRDFLKVTEGLLLPDKPGVPGVSRINTSPFPRSRYKVNPTLRLPRPPRQHKPGVAPPRFGV